MDSQKQTGKQSGEVIENTYLWKKQTENKPNAKRAMSLKTRESGKRIGANPASR